MIALIVLAAMLALSVALVPLVHRRLMRERVKAAQDTRLADAMRRMTDDLVQIGEEIGRALTPAFRGLAAAMSEFAAAFNRRPS